jgi:hypothetical protein
MPSDEPNPDEYLAKILARQTFANDAPELKDLRERRKNIEEKLREHFSKANPSFLWAGSMAKGTMIRESYDGDLTFYVPHEEETAGATLKEIYENVETVLKEDYDVERKPSALRIKDRSTKATKGFAQDLHIDLVPGRYTDEKKGDVYLHRTTGEKDWLKTNLQIHIDHIKDSSVTGAIQLMKLWNARNGIRAKTFVLELLVVKLLKEKKKLSLSAQVQHVWTEFRDNAESLVIEDPANGNNDLKPALDAVCASLASVASTTLAGIKSRGWSSVFGELPDDEEEKSKVEALRVAAAARIAPTPARPSPSRPWCRRA